MRCSEKAEDLWFLLLLSEDTSFHELETEVSPHQHVDRVVCWERCRDGEKDVLCPSSPLAVETEL